MAERYKIYEQLGSGGMGAVFRAYDNDLKRWVAIKRLTNFKEGVADESLISDLRREADALASLRNPNIVTIFDVASDAEGLFMVMELLEGEDLADVVTRGPLHYDDFKELASQTLEGLLAAHQRHILHRDIKPENIKVERLPGGRMQSKIIDFGLARAGLRARKQTEDQSGTVMGSIYYMAPEQLTRQPVDERTDLYSLGCVFYEALSGRKAFDGESVAMVIDKHINHDLVPLHVIAPHVPPWLGAWVLRLMARWPDDRPANAQQAIQEFRAWEKISAAPPMMPWMPAGYAPMPGAYPQQPYPGTVTTSSVPVQPGYYQTGQVSPQHYPTGQIPAQPYQSAPVLVAPTASPAAAPQPQPARAPQKRSSGPAAHALGSRTVGPAADHPPSPIKTYALVGLGIIAVLIIGMTFLGDQKKTSPRDAGKAPAAQAGTGPKGPEKLHFQLPQDRQFPPQDMDLVVHLVANSGASKASRDASGMPHAANNGDPAPEWHDLASRGQGNGMYAWKNTADHAPLRQFWNHPNAKSSRAVLDFRSRNGKFIALLLSDPANEAAQFPFGSASVKGPRGMTLCLVFQAADNALPTEVASLASADGSTVSLKVSVDKSLVAEFKNSSGSRSIITSKNVDPTKPISAILTWQSDTGITSLRARDGTGNTYSADGSKVTPPGSPLTRFQIGRADSESGTQHPMNQQFNGWFAEALLYASVLRSDQLQLLDGPNIRDYYFNSITPVAQRLKTKLPLIEPRSSWSFSPSQNSNEAKNVADGNVTSRWSTKARQSPGQWFQIDLPQQQNIAGVALDCQAASGDYPRRFTIETSNDGQSWTKEAERDGTGPLIEVIFDSPRPAKHLRIMQTSTTPSNDWAICELVLFKN